MRILVLDDHCGKVMKKVVVKVGHDVHTAEDGYEALKVYYDNGPFDVVLTDIDHPGFSAVDFQKRFMHGTPSRASRL